MRFQKNDDNKEMIDFVICIRIKETLSEDWSDWLDGLLFTRDESGNTILIGSVLDQAALRGILGKLWDLNLTILSFSFVDSAHI
jgi:hypothetical protein